MKRFKDYEPGQLMLLPPSLEELIDKNDMVRVINHVVESLDIKEIEEGFKGGGCPSYNPKMMLKVIIYAYSNKLYSSRQIAKALKRDVAFMWLSGMQRPDFNTVNRFRSDYFKESLSSVFSKVVNYLLENGYVKSEDYFLDGTKFEADAGKYSHVWKANTTRYKAKVTKRIEEILAEVDRINSEEDKLFEGKDLPEYGEGKPISSDDVKKIAESINAELKSKKVKKAKNELQKAGEQLKKYEEQEAVLKGRNSYSKTDVEATFMRLKNDELRAAYNVQAGTENGFVVGLSVHQNANDATTLKEHLKQRTEQGLPEPKRIVSDAGYGTEENYKELKRRKIGNFLKYPTFRSDMQGKESPFKYDSKKDIYTCPQGRKLKFEKTYKETSKSGHVSSLRQYVCTSCKWCRSRSLCGRNKPRGNRTLRINKKLESFKLAARRNLSSPQGIVLRRRRGNEIESIWGDLKHNQAYKRIRLRGIIKAKLDLTWLFITSNLRKLANMELSLAT